MLVSSCSKFSCWISTAVCTTCNSDLVFARDVWIWNTMLIMFIQQLFTRHLQLLLLYQRHPKKTWLLFVWCHPFTKLHAVRENTKFWPIVSNTQVEAGMTDVFFRHHQFGRLWLPASFMGSMKLEMIACYMGSIIQTPLYEDSFQQTRSFTAIQHGGSQLWAYMLHRTRISWLLLFYLVSQVDFGRSVDVSEAGTVAVIDGQDLLLTLLQEAVIPPPMSAYRASFPAPVNCITFLPDSDEVILHSTWFHLLAVLQHTCSLCYCLCSWNFW